MFTNSEGEYGKYIVQDLRDPGLGSPEFQEMYRKFSRRILWMDTNVVEGAFQMNTAWYMKVPEKPYELGADLEVTINGEVHAINRTSFIYCPAGLKHMPLSIKKVDRPIFHFSIVMGPEYSGLGAYK